MKNPTLIIYPILMFLFFTSIGIAQIEIDPNNIIDKTIESYGGEIYKNAAIEFDFRGRHYKILRNKGKILFERTYKDTAGNIKEGFNNKIVFKEVDGQAITLTEGKANSIKESVNSAVYFFSLPYLLNDRAIIKKYLGVGTVKGKTYYKIGVTFKQEGGGVDYQDRYVYWIHKENYSMDYFAYDFKVNGGGSRFRRIHNKRSVIGIIFADQENFTSEKININIEDYDKMYEEENLMKISDINIDNVKVNLLE